MQQVRFIECLVGPPSHTDSFAIYLRLSGLIYGSEVTWKLYYTGLKYKMDVRDSTK